MASKLQHQVAETLTDPLKTIYLAYPVGPNNQGGPAIRTADIHGVFSGAPFSIQCQPVVLDSWPTTITDLFTVRVQDVTADSFTFYVLRTDRDNYGTGWALSLSILITLTGYTP